jgi:hypothetical protein
MIKGSGKKAPTTTEMKLRQIEEEIRCRAHELYEQRGRADGHDLEDWLRAEEEIAKKKVRSIAA